MSAENDSEVVGDYGGMEIAGTWRTMQELHLIESGNVRPSEVSRVGWVRALSDARAKKIGKPASQIAEEFMDWSRQVEVESEGILVVGILTAVTVE